MSVHFEISQGLRVDNLEELQTKVQLRGGRLVAYSEVVSALMLSARAYRVRWVAAETERVAAGAPSSVLTSVLGWWAIPGPLWSATALIWNCRGGVDLTESLMAAQPGVSSLIRYSDKAALERFHESARSLAVKIVVLAALVPVGAFGYMLWYCNRG